MTNCCRSGRGNSAELPRRRIASSSSRGLPPRRVLHLSPPSMGGSWAASRLHPGFEPWFHPKAAKRDAQRTRRRPFKLSAIVRATCDEFSNQPTKVVEKRSRHPARAIVALLGREHCSATLAQIAHALGLARRDSVSHLSKKAFNAPPGSHLAGKLDRVRQRLLNETAFPA